MNLSSLAGNGPLKDQLTQRQAGRGLSHAYLISGPLGSGRHTLARLLAGAMVCTAQPGGRPCGLCGPCKKVSASLHPDVITIAGAAGKPITVDQVRALRTDAHIRPNEGARKVYLLEETHRMNAAAQNAMLKLLEEGPPYAAFLLLADNPGGVLQTVRSRCEELALTPVPPAQCRAWLAQRFPDRDPALLDRIALDCQGILGRAVEALEGEQADLSARRTLARTLAQLVARGTEGQLFEGAMALDKQSREELPLLLASLEEELVHLMGQDPQKRTLKGIELTRQLRAAAQLNANAGQLAGWLCAGMFLGDRS